MGFGIVEPVVTIIVLLLFLFHWRYVFIMSTILVSLLSNIICCLVFYVEEIHQHSLWCSCN